MKRALCIAAAFAIAFCGPAVANPQLILRIPVEVENLPAEVVRGQLECAASSGATFDPTHILAEGIGQFAIEGGRHSGRVSVAFAPGGYLPTADATADIRSYSCALVLLYHCTASSGVGLGWCSSSRGGAAGARATATAATLFATDPARPPNGIIVGAIDRTTATTLPIRR
jgi:hypothetical protein